MTQSSYHQLTERLAHLLAESSLGESVKKDVLNNLDKLPDGVLFELVDSLENERTDLKNLLFDLQSFSQKQESAWASLEAQQEEAGQKTAEIAVRKIVQDVQLSTVRESLK